MIPQAVRCSNVDLEILISSLIWTDIRIFLGEYMHPRFTWFHVNLKYNLLSLFPHFTWKILFVGGFHMKYTKLKEISNLKSNFILYKNCCDQKIVQDRFTWSYPPFYSDTLLNTIQLHAQEGCHMFPAVHLNRLPA